MPRISMPQSWLSPKLQRWGVAVSMGIDTKKQTLWGGGAPQVGDLRLLEDGSERGGALVSDLVVVETVRVRRGADMVRE